MTFKTALLAGIAGGAALLSSTVQHAPLESRIADAAVYDQPQQSCADYGFNLTDVPFQDGIALKGAYLVDVQIDLSGAEPKVTKDVVGIVDNYCSMAFGYGYKDDHGQLKPGLAMAGVYVGKPLDEAQKAAVQARGFGTRPASVYPAIGISGPLAPASGISVDELVAQYRSLMATDPNPAAVQFTSTQDHIAYLLTETGLRFSTVVASD